MKIVLRRALWAGLLCATLARAAGNPLLSEAELQARLAARYEADRTGACVVAALIDGAEVHRAQACAKTREGQAPGYRTAFEIGSITKTMTAFLVADLIQTQGWSLDDPIATHLPAGTVVPSQGERQILVRDILTHRSGLPALPPGFAPVRQDDPYADLTEARLLGALAQTRLTRPIGSQFEYSNFAMMLMSLAVSNAYGSSYEAALRAHLFQPLGMAQAFVYDAPADTERAGGHLSSGLPTSDWHNDPKLAGVGMVRASLDDMVRYAQAQMGVGRKQADPRMGMTQQTLLPGAGMNWMLNTVAGQNLVWHSGATGGFSAVLMMQPQGQRAVVILADASQPDPLEPLALHLLGLRAEPDTPRVAQDPPAALLQAMVGDYEMQGRVFHVQLEEGHLKVQGDGQAPFELLYDSRGDFYPRLFSGLFRPRLRQGQVVGGLWAQGGGAVDVKRRGVDTTPTAANPAWKAWAGEYALMPGFTLKVFEEDGLLKIQGTGQPAFAAEVTGTDRIEVKSVGAVMEFKRDDQGKVLALVLHQNGAVIEGKRL